MDQDQFKNVKHPLEHVWTIWYLDGNMSKSWEECLVNVGSFSTAEDFWCLFQHLKPASMLKCGCDYSLFKDGIRPMWEDDANKDGGRWLINLDRKTSPQMLDDYWLEIVMCMIGEGFDGLNDLINGATLNLRSAGNRIGIWLRSSNNVDNQIKKIGQRIKEVLGVDQPIKFQNHLDVQNKAGVNQARTTFCV